jgi:hypothetical protein
MSRKGGPNLFLSSQTDKLMAGTKFSDYLGLKHYKKAKKLKHFIHLILTTWPQSLSTYHSISPYRPYRPLTKKVYSSDVKNCLISIFELKVTVKISAIFMSFSNPTCHFRDTADFT